MKQLVSLLTFVFFMQTAFAFTVDKTVVPGKYVDDAKGYYFVTKKDKVKIKLPKKFYLKHQSKNYIKAKVNVEPLYHLKNLNVQKLDSGQYKKYYYSLLGFYIKLEQRNAYLFEKNDMFSFFDFFIQEAYASDAPFTGKVCDDHGGELKNKCLFGGWPSVQTGRFCTGPWKHKNNPIIQGINPSTYQNACGSKNLFRCNPDIFGKFDAKNDADNSMIDTSKSDHSGLCVKTDGTYNNITKLCQDASAHSPTRIKEIVETNPKPNFSNMRDLATCFCQSKPDYDACRVLESQLGKLNEPTESETRQPPVAVNFVEASDPEPVIEQTAITCDEIQKVGAMQNDPNATCSADVSTECSYFITCKSNDNISLKLPAVCKCSEADQNSHLECIAEVQESVKAQIRVQQNGNNSQSK